MTRFRLATTNRYERDVANVLGWSEEQFGQLAAARYLALIRTGGRMVAEDPYKLATRTYGPELGYACSLHLRHVPGEVRHPRHILYFTIDEKRRVVTLRRLLHESMDLDRQLSTLAPESG